MDNQTTQEAADKNLFSEVKIVIKKCSGECGDNCCKKTGKDCCGGGGHHHGEEAYDENISK